MVLYKRLKMGIVSRIDWMVGQIENHEGLVNGVIIETRQAVAKAKVQLARVREDGARLRDRLATEANAQQKWRDRARQCCNDDENRALECLKRSKLAERKVPELRARLEEHAHIEGRLATDVSALEDNLAQLIEKRNLMRSRQSRAEALSSLHSTTTTVSGDVSEIFDRWEMRVTEAEFEGGCGLTTDSLESEFVTAEEEEELKQELDEIKVINSDVKTAAGNLSEKEA